MYNDNMKLGFDIGTTTISCVVLEENKVIDSKTIINDTFIDETKTQDVNRIIEKSLCLIHEFLSKYSIESIGLTGQMHGILYLDDYGKSVSPLYTWQDQSSSNIIDEINQYTKYQVFSGYGLATHIHHIQSNLVPLNAKSICTIMDYFGMVLTNRSKPLLHTSNAASLGFFDIEKNEFEKEGLKKLNVELDILPQVTNNIEQLGTYQKIPVYVAIGDNQASFLGAVGNHTNTVLVNMGTGGQVSILTNNFVQIEGIEIRPFINNQYLLVGASLCGGQAYALLEKFFREYVKEATGIEMSQYDVMERLANKCNSNSLNIQTTLNGTRMNPNQTGSILNITEENILPGFMINGFMVGMIEELFEMYQMMNIQATIVMASGNGFRKNKTLQKICEEKFQLPLKLANEIEEAACGAAMSVE